MPEREDAAAASDSDSSSKFSYCSLREVPERTFAASVSPGRASAILTTSNKWVNGTVLHYYFFDEDGDGEYVYFRNGSREWRSWVGADTQKEVVRGAFKQWKDLGIGLEFTEVASRDDAELRIGFMRGDGAWSYVGSYALNIGQNQRTINYGWDLTGFDGMDTALHEIGHAIGLPHEHQNPNAGIVWDEEAVYAALAGPPNNWSRDKTYHNIIRKIPADTVQGSDWDANSIMHYPFEAGLIEAPAQYRSGISPEPGLSPRDKTWISKFYPPLAAEDEVVLERMIPSMLEIGEGEQANFVIRPEATRSYHMQTFGTSDNTMVLFEDDGGDPRYMAADDDSGHERNASIEARLYKGRSYILRVRLNYSDQSGGNAVMYW